MLKWVDLLAKWTEEQSNLPMQVDSLLNLDQVMWVGSQVQTQVAQLIILTFGIPRPLVNLATESFQFHKAKQLAQWNQQVLLQVPPGTLLRHQVPQAHRPLILGLSSMVTQNLCFYQNGAP